MPYKRKRRVPSTQESMDTENTPVKSENSPQSAKRTRRTRKSALCDIPSVNVKTEIIQEDTSTSLEEEKQGGADALSLPELTEERAVSEQEKLLESSVPSRVSGRLSSKKRLTWNKKFQLVNDEGGDLSDPAFVEQGSPTPKRTPKAKRAFKQHVTLAAEKGYPEIEEDYIEQELIRHCKNSDEAIAFARFVVVEKQQIFFKTPDLSTEEVSKLITLKWKKLSVKQRLQHAPPAEENISFSESAIGSSSINTGLISQSVAAALGIETQPRSSIMRKTKPSMIFGPVKKTPGRPRARQIEGYDRNVYTSDDGYYVANNGYYRMSRTGEVFVEYPQYSSSDALQDYYEALCEPAFPPSGYVNPTKYSANYYYDLYCYLLAQESSFNF